MGKAISLHLLVVHGLEIVIVIFTVQTVRMAFPIDERVIMHYCTGDPLVNGESHFTASFGGSWFRNCNCIFYCSNC